MRRAFFLGWVLIAWPVMALAQVNGFVESIGFNNSFRPDCWTPMLVSLSSQNPHTETYQIQIVQEDLDKDSVTFTRDITLNAGMQQKFWAYFLPQPTNGGLPTTSIDALQRVLKVYLCEKPSAPGGRGKQIMQLPVRFMIDNLDPAAQTGEHPRGHKLVLWVTDGSSRLAWQEYSQALGTMEDVTFVPLHPRDLPEEALAYDAVDAILWLSGDSDQLSEGGSTRKEAIAQWIHAGGQLVACQTQRPNQLSNLSDLLPINPREVVIAEHRALEPLSRLARPKRHLGQDTKLVPLGAYWHDWDLLEKQQSWRMGRAKPLEGAVVEDWIDWEPSDTTAPSAVTTRSSAIDPPATDRTPWLVRRAVGLGSVSWVAQDLGDPALAGTHDAAHNLISPSFGWSYLWDHVFGWNNATYLPPNSDFLHDPNHDFIAKAYESNFTDSTFDAASNLFGGTQFEGKGFTLMGIAIVFFIIYWFAAGPGSYFYLAHKQRRHLSWLIFGAAAVAAALLTVVLVRLVLRGDPELKHRSIVRRTEGEPAHVRSRIGLYIPRDGLQSIELHDTSVDAVSMLTPLIVHPQSVSDTEFPAAQEYVIPVRDAADGSLPIRVPFRSTLKKLEARWVGDLSGGFAGSARLLPSTGTKGLIAGSVTNQTGADLVNVYLFFNHPRGGSVSEDWALYIPSWAKDKTFDLGAEFDNATGINNKGNPDGKHGSVKGLIDAPNGWFNYWYYALGSVSDDTDLRISLPVLTMFNRLPPPRRDDTPSEKQSRFDLYRRGGRELDRSGSMLAGKLIVIGETEGPNPVPMTVNDTAYPGDGLTGTQAVVPLNRDEALGLSAPQPTSRAATQPGTQPAKKTF